MGQVKDAVVHAVQGIGHGVDDAMHTATDKLKQVENVVTGGVAEKNGNSETEYTYIPLKDPNVVNDDEHLAEFKENLLKKAQSFSDDTEKLADDLIKDTEDVVTNETAAVAETVESMLNDKLLLNEINVDDKTPTHSIDSLKTSSPEPEIEKALENVQKPNAPSPEPTLTEMSDMKSESPTTEVQQ